MFKILQKLKCKLFVCCGSKCSLNDENGDGVIDSITIENIKENPTLV